MLHNYVNSKQKERVPIQAHTVETTLVTDAAESARVLNDYFQSVFVLEPTGDFCIENKHVWSELIIRR